MEILERYIFLDEELVFVRQTEMLPKRPTLLFLHGLGESGLCFVEAFSCARLSGYNLIVPDHVGYGRSSQASGGDYSFSRMIQRLERTIAVLGAEEITLVGHSMGGILGTLWCRQDGTGRIRKMVNVEGNLTTADAVFSGRAAGTFENLGRDLNLWKSWFYSQVSGPAVFDLPDRASSRRYRASLLFARPEAFLANSLEIVERGRTVGADQVTGMGEAYRSLRIPRAYFWGEESLSSGSQEFLTREGLLNRGFPGAGHWVMVDSPEFYPALADFLAGG